ncbi:MAG: branched-chain amino acid ABC transporter permease [Erysipelotrichia bacterium]|nr:branched-chain amino acid ABC transporter permease [Erysipelotrichia bacterium]
MKKLLQKKNRSRIFSFALILIVWMVITVLKSSGSLTRQISSLLVPIACYIVAAIGLNLNVGVSGELNLGQAGFMSIGGFTAAIVAYILKGTISNGAILLLVAILAGAVMAGLFGWLISIPVLKLQGDYLAIVTLAFGQIIMSILNNLYIGFDSAGLHFAFGTNTLKLLQGGKMIISGPMGVAGNQMISNYTAGILLIIASLFIVYNIIYSRSGRAIMACRDNRIAAETVGIRVSRIKTLAFVVSSALAGAAGALYMMNYSSVAASKFDFNTSILILVYVVLGGLGNMTGTIIATTLLVALPEMLRFLSSYRMLIYAIVLIVIMIVSNNEKTRLVMAEIKVKLFRKKGAQSNV